MMHTASSKHYKSAGDADSASIDDGIGLLFSESVNGVKGIEVYREAAKQFM